MSREHHAGCIPSRIMSPWLSSALGQSQVMTLREHIHETPARAAMIALAGCFSLSCITLLGEGLDHLRFFLPLAAFNALVGAFTSERVARVVFATEVAAIFTLLGYTVFQLHERFPNT
jgi:hypothetical protein